MCIRAGNPFICVSKQSLQQETNNITYPQSFDVNERPLSLRMIFVDLSNSQLNQSNDNQVQTFDVFPAARVLWLDCIHG